MRLKHRTLVCIDRVLLPRSGLSAHRVGCLAHSFCTYIFWAGYSHKLLLFLDKTLTSDKSCKFKGTQEGEEAAFKPKQSSFRPNWTTKLFNPSVAFLQPWGRVYPLDHDHVLRAGGAGREWRVTESSSPMGPPQRAWTPTLWLSPGGWGVQTKKLPSVAGRLDINERAVSFHTLF